MRKTKFFSQQERKWLIVDARDKLLGRLASQIAKILQGKDKATYSPNALCGDKVVVINAKYIKLSQDKSQKKIYDKYSGYPSGRKEIIFATLMEKNPSRALYMAIKGMLPKNSLGRMMLKGLRIYPERVHNQQAQKPQAVDI